MPKTKSAAIRYRIIDQCLTNKRHRYPTLEYMATRCAEMLDTEVSVSTIEKDIAAMKKPYPQGFDAPIIFSRQHLGYAYSEVGFTIAELSLSDEEWNALRFSAQLLYQYRQVPIFDHFRQAIERINTRFSLGLDPQDPVINEYVHFESANGASGQEWIHDIYDAIRKRQQIRIAYQNIYKHKVGSYLIQPCLLKEHRNRWYVIGWSEERNDYLTFALDRIHTLENTGLTSAKRIDFRADSFFQHATGIMEGGSPIQVELEISEPISRLVLLEPIHPSQELIEDNNGIIRIRMEVYDNEEFRLRILGYGPWCRVLQPQSLKVQVQELITKMSNMQGK